MAGEATGTVVLAAGAASRFGSPKQVLLLPRVLERVREAPVSEIVVVEGAHALDAVPLEGARLVKCADWAVGPGASLRCGLAALGDGVEGALVILADGPNLDLRTIDRVLGHRGEADVIAASYGGIREHPVYLTRAAWARVPDEGMRALDALLVPCDDLTAPGDIDTPDDLAGLTRV
jgi:nicotine blue oxidoreductase